MGLLNFIGGLIALAGLLFAYIFTFIIAPFIIISSLFKK